MGGMNSPIELNNLFMKNLLTSLLAVIGITASAQNQPSTSPVTWDNIHLQQKPQPTQPANNGAATWDNIHLQPRAPAPSTLGAWDTMHLRAQTNNAATITNAAAASWDTMHLRQQPLPRPVLGGWGWDVTPPIPGYGNGLGGKEWHRNYLGGLLDIQAIFILNTQQRSGPNWMLVPTYPGQVIQFGGGSGGSGSWDNMGKRTPASGPGGWDTMGKK